MEVTFEHPQSAAARTAAGSAAASPGVEGTAEVGLRPVPPAPRRHDLSDRSSAQPRRNLRTLERE